uniref:hypothetical protein n=1 Tax=Escherichia coli TaxID=562 RepID=UPI0021C1A9C3
VTRGWELSPRQPSGKNIIRWLLKKEQMAVSAIASTPQRLSITHMATFFRLSDLRGNTPDNYPGLSVDIFMIICPPCLQKVLISHIRQHKGLPAHN